MGRAWRVGVREGDAPLFVSHGLFRFSRNPIFLGMILVSLSAAIASATWWGWVALMLFIASCIVQVRIEESHLEASFGDAYRAFRRQVPRWLGLARSA
jgi:protein-S-isoprenylcysteine O-methyltransferase Ste14